MCESFLKRERKPGDIFQGAKYLETYGALYKLLSTPVMGHIFKKLCDHCFILCTFQVPPSKSPIQGWGEGIFLNLACTLHDIYGL